LTIATGSLTATNQNSAGVTTNTPPEQK
jgi:hypothetical protein